MYEGGGARARARREDETKKRARRERKRERRGVERVCVRVYADPQSLCSQYSIAIARKER